MFEGKEYIYEVYKEKSFSKAAKNLYISQPSLSASVRRIEQKLGTPVFDRSSSPIQLTECGQTYIKAIQEIMEIERSFQDYLDNLQHLQTGTLSIGGSSLFASYVLPPLIAQFTKKYPLITINLLEETTSNLEHLLLEGTLDLIIDNFQIEDESLQKYFYQPEHLLAAVPMSFPVNQHLSAFALDPLSILSGSYLDSSIPCVPFHVFKEEPFLFLKPENDTMQRGMKICKKYGFQPHILLHLDQQITAYNITCSGMGICFVSDTLIRSTSPHPNVIYYKLDFEESVRSICFYRKRNRYLSFAVKEFLHMACTDSLSDQTALL
ncbi:MAG: LysR family transcriptional regulator [Clostridiales bacterium]|nr:LysR family transcriptional regulator [Clostridiales bacterium]